MWMVPLTMFSYHFFPTTLMRSLMLSVNGTLVIAVLAKGNWAMEQWTHSLAKFCLVSSACYELFCYFLVLPYPRSRRNSARVLLLPNWSNFEGFTQTMIINFTSMQIAFSIKALEGRLPAVGTCRFWRSSSPQIRASDIWTPDITLYNGQVLLALKRIQINVKCI